MDYPSTGYILSSPDHYFSHARNLDTERMHNNISQLSGSNTDTNDLIENKNYYYNQMKLSEQNRVCEMNNRTPKIQPLVHGKYLKSSLYKDAMLESNLNENEMTAIDSAYNIGEHSHTSYQFFNDLSETPDITSQLKRAGDKLQRFSPSLTETPVNPIFTPNSKSVSTFSKTYNRKRTTATPSTAASSVSTSFPKLKPMKLQFYRTKLCPWVIASGHCRKDATCRYAHSVEDLRPLPDLSRTKMCDGLIKNGKCPDSVTCKYAHSYDELRATQSFNKTKICPSWISGNCSSEMFCRFAHGEEELRGDPVSQAKAKETAQKLAEQQMNSTPQPTKKHVSLEKPLSAPQASTQQPFYSAAPWPVIQMNSNWNNTDLQCYPIQPEFPYSSFHLSSPSSQANLSPVRSPSNITYLPTQAWNSVSQKHSGGIDEFWQLQTSPQRVHDYPTASMPSNCIDSNLVITHLLPSGIFTPMTRRIAESNMGGSKAGTTVAPGTLLRSSATLSSSYSSSSSLSSCMEAKKHGLCEETNYLSTPKLVVNYPSTVREKSLSPPSLPPPLSYSTDVISRPVPTEMLCYATPIPIYASQGSSSPVIQNVNSSHTPPHHQNLFAASTRMMTANAQSYGLRSPIHQSFQDPGIVTAPSYFQRHVVLSTERPSFVHRTNPSIHQRWEETTTPSTSNHILPLSVLENTCSNYRDTGYTEDSLNLLMPLKKPTSVVDLNSVDSPKTLLRLHSSWHTTQNLPETKSFASDYALNSSMTQLHFHTNSEDDDDIVENSHHTSQLSVGTDILHSKF